MKKFILILLVLAFSSKLFSQDLIKINTPKEMRTFVWQIEKKNYKYEYRGDKVRYSVIKKLVHSTEDPGAIGYYSSFELGLGWGIASLGLGCGLLIGGAIKHFDETFLVFEPNYKSGRTAMWTGGFLMVFSNIPLISAQKSLRNSIHKYNSLQQQSTLKLGVMGSGFGLRYNF